MKRLITSESVCAGHPDKVCDAISDAVLDAYLAADPLSRVACETAATTNFVLVMGEVTSKAEVDVEKIVRKTLREIGYDSGEKGIDADKCEVMVRISAQSPDISMGVDSALETRGQEVLSIGAGDQGLMFGFASSETADYMPMPISLAKRLTRGLEAARLSGRIPYLRPDGKAQVTVEYHDGKPLRVHTVIVSAQHDENVSHETIEKDIIEAVIKESIPACFLDEDTRLLVNPTGRFVIGGPEGDSGLTGRKIIVDSYGGYCPHGGGAYSGKDPTKVDRSASYAARYVAKNIVASGLADTCQVEVAYAIGVARPVSLSVDTRGTGKLSDEALTELVLKCVDLRPQAIIETLNLRRPIYRQTASYGPFGGEESTLPWERLDLCDKLRNAAKELESN